MITLFGATGYTGRLVAKELARLDIPFRLAGRSAQKLVNLSNSLPAPPPWLVADATQSEPLSALFQDTRVLVNCAGPFTDLGEPVVAQAALNGVHYLDTSNELGFVYRMWGYDELAQQCGAAIVPACGFEVALADCAAAVLAAGMESVSTVPAANPNEEAPPLDEISIVYDLGGKGSSLGSRRSAVRALATSWLGYSGGQWMPAMPCREVRRVQLAGHSRPVLSFPSGEITTTPRHLAVGKVTTWLAVSWHAFYWAPALLPIFAWLARGPVGSMIGTIISSVAAPPETGLRSTAPFLIRVDVRRGVARQTMTLTGQGVYDLTAKIVAYAASELARPGYDREGVLAPAAALDPQALLDQVTARWRIRISQEAGDEG